MARKRKHRQVATTVRSFMLSSGMMGSRATCFSVYTNDARNSALAGRHVSTSGCVHGTTVPAELTASRNSVRNATRFAAPR